MDIRSLFQLFTQAIEKQHLKQQTLLSDRIHNNFGRVAFFHRDFEFSQYLHGQVQFTTRNLTQKGGLLESYFGIAECFFKLGKYRESIRNAKRALEICFYLNDYKTELRIYDLVGKLYFHLGDMQKAGYFHQRMMRGQLEPEESAIRMMFLCKLSWRDEKLKMLSLRYLNPAQENESKSSFQNNPEPKKTVFESDDEGDAEMPISFLTGPAYQEKEQRSNFPIYFKLKREFFERSNNLPTQSKKSKVNTNLGKQSQASSDAYAWAKEFQEDIHIQRFLQHQSSNRESDIFMQFKTRSSDSLSYYKLQDEISFKAVPSKLELQSSIRSLVYIIQLISTLQHNLEILG